MNKVICCLVGKLMGDAWMTLAPLIDICAQLDVHVISGSYALPVWEWAQRNVEGATYTIDRVIEDPDDIKSPYCPGYGYIAMDRAIEFVRSEMPEETVIGVHELGSSYNRAPRLKTTGFEVKDGEAVVIHPFSRHDWKNEMDMVARVSYQRPVQLVGLPGEFKPVPGWTDLTGGTFDGMVAAVLQAHCFVGVLSSFTNLAAIFGKKQVIVSFTTDVPINNSRARILVKPSIEELQSVITEEGL